MSRLSDLGHQWWIGAQLGAPSFIQRSVIPHLHKAKEIVRMLAKPYLTLYQLQGQGQAGPLTVTYGGLGYAKPMLKSILFAEEPTEKEIGRVPLWRLSEVPELSKGDLIIIEASKHLIRRLARHSAIVLPWWVQLMLDVRGEWEDVMQRFHRTVRKQEIRLVRKHGYEYVVSHSNKDFEMFYDDMYVPSMKARHGSLASLTPIGEAHQYFRHGWLFLIKRDGRYVSGCICYAQQGAIRFSDVGVLNGDEQLMREGAQGAVYYAMVHWANQQGYAAVDFLGSRPFLSSGMFRYKRKWGVTASISPHQHKQIWIRIQRNTPAVSQFLQSNPCVIVDSGGELYGLITTDDPKDVSPETEAKWQKLYATPGLCDLLVFSVKDLMEKPAF